MTKRKRSIGEVVSEAYKAVSFACETSTGHPRSPHRFFKESYTASFSEENVPEDPEKSESSTSKGSFSQVVHLHVNGLCIVTAGRVPPDQSVDEIKFVAKAAPAFSAAEKRKRNAKLLRGGELEHTISPTSTIAEVKLSSGELISLKACVWGTILELNESLTPEVLLDDPLLDGFLAVILPSGDFPPRKGVPKKDEGERKTKVAKETLTSTNESRTVPQSK